VPQNFIRSALLLVKPARGLFYNICTTYYIIPFYRLSFYSTLIKFRIRWEGHVASMGEGRGVYGVLLRKPEGKRPLGRPWRRLEGKIKADLQEVGCEEMDWIELAQHRDSWRTLVYAVMNLWV
jgi:hypothetical protein